jgi:membrane protein required for colicin V production
MIFDVVIYAAAALAVIFGFRSGLLRSIATILGYVIAAPVALAVAPAVTLFLEQRYAMPPAYNGVVLASLVLVAGTIAGMLLRRAVTDVVGPHPGLGDRIAGALLGAVRIGLVAVLIVVIFDRIIPVNRQPAFLAESKLRPYLTAAGQAGVKALPPDAMDFIDRLKRERGL